MALCLDSVYTCLYSGNESRKYLLCKQLYPFFQINVLFTAFSSQTCPLLCYFSYNNRTRTEINLNTVYDAMYRHIAISRKNGCKKSKVEMKKCAPCHTCYNSNLFQSKLQELKPTLMFGSQLQLKELCSGSATLAQRQ